MFACNMWWEVFWNVGFVFKFCLGFFAFKMDFCHAIKLLKKLCHLWGLTICWFLSTLVIVISRSGWCEGKPFFTRTSTLVVGFLNPGLLLGPVPVDYRIRSNFWKFYLIRTRFTLGEPVSLVKVFQTFYHYKVNYFNYFFSYSGCDNL